MIINTLMFRLKRTSTKSRVLCGDKKGSKRKLYMGYVCSDTFWVFNTKVCFKKGACISLSSLADSDLWVHGGPAHPDPNFSQTCGLQVWSEKRELKPDDGDGHENGKKSNSFRLAEQKLCTFLCRRWEISIPHKLGFSEISSPQSLLPSNVQISNLMLINLFIIVFILLVIHCVWQNNKIK